MMPKTPANNTWPTGIIGASLTFFQNLFGSLLGFIVWMSAIAVVGLSVVALLCFGLWNRFSVPAPVSVYTPAASVQTIPSGSTSPSVPSTGKSILCYTAGAESSLTYTQLMTSNPNREVHLVAKIADCPFGEVSETVFFHWTQKNPHGDVLGDTQGWFRQGSKENAIEECKLQDGWCLLANN